MDPNIHYKLRDLFFAIIIFLMITGTFYYVFIILEAPIQFSLLMILIFLLILHVFEVYLLIPKHNQIILEHLQRQIDLQKWHYKQTASLFSIFSLLDINHPVKMVDSGYEVSPEFAHLIISTILEKKPGTVLELGSGLSTILAGYALKKVGKGRLVSIDHQKQFTDSVNNDIKKHSLQQYAEVIHSPLKEISFNGRSWLWYDQDKIKVRDIDLLVIDGPPGYLQKLSRYPALPVLFSKLSSNAVILLDDGYRSDEKTMVDLWLMEFKTLDCSFHKLGKGAFVLTKSTTLP